MFENVNGRTAFEMNTNKSLFKAGAVDYSNIIENNMSVSPDGPSNAPANAM
jgi:hypothetical protein